MKKNIQHSGRQSLPHPGRSIIRTIYEAQHRRLPACSRKYWLLFMKNNIECFLCDVPNMGLPAHSVSPLLTLFIIRRVAKSTSTLLNSKYFNIYTKNWSLKLVQIKLKEKAMFATFWTHMLGQGVFGLTRPQTNTPWLWQTLHLMLLLTTQALHKHHKHSRASSNTTFEGSSVHSSTLHQLSGE